MLNKLFGSLINPITGLLEKAIPDRDKRNKLAHEIATMAEKQAHAIALAQIEVNKIEAQSPSFFKSSWRPFIGWVCGIAFAYHFVLRPFLIFGLTVYGIQIPSLPVFDMSTLMTVLGGLLGLGTLRTYEKSKGLTR